eukprot:TRINITY_DN69845_c0_g1_i1.p1 TRINITY_DN69845_c0_g1~~TRINITY_DN69845_c0_g1_i1.p1  ORF type:complete len:415 (+),score=47.25 TRINITY_DN69845_c0_g1_i1:72-1247(+)
MADSGHGDYTAQSDTPLPTEGGLKRKRELAVDPREDDKNGDWGYVTGDTNQVENSQGKAGASINAKALEGKPPEDLSFLMHALYGMDQYPNYLLKWPHASIEKLATMLQAKASEARSAAAAVLARQAFVDGYTPLHPELRSPDKSVLAPTARAALSALKTGDGSAARAALSIAQEADGIFSFELLTPECCDMVRSEIENFLVYRTQYIKQHGLPSGTVRERLMLAELGLTPLSDYLFTAVAQPLCRVLFSGTISELDSAHAYTVGYGPAERAGENVTRKALIPHVDDSEITLNVCLQDGFVGGGLVFHGRRTPATIDPHELPNRDEYSYTHRLGRAVLHLGNHFHEVADVSAGARHVLIVWMRSWKAYRGSHCPCCMKFRRENCVCGPAWN